MANLKLSQLPVASALTGDEVVPMVQGGQTKRSTVAALADMRKGPWQLPTFNAPWANYGDVFATAGYRRDGSRVQLRGVVRGGSGGSVVFTVPVGYRPQMQQIFLTLSDAAAATRVDVRPTGEVFVGLPPSANIEWLSLDGIGYYTD